MRKPTQSFVWISKICSFLSRLRADPPKPRGNRRGAEQRSHALIQDQLSDTGPLARKATCDLQYLPVDRKAG